MLARRPRRGRGSRGARAAWCWDRPPVLGSCWDDPLQNRVSAGGSSALWIPVQRVRSMRRTPECAQAGESAPAAARFSKWMTIAATVVTISSAPQQTKLIRPVMSQ